MVTPNKEWAKAEATGWRRFDNADFHGALDAWYDAAYTLDETPENAREVATSLQHVALAHSKLGDLGAAARYLQRALAIHYEAPPPTLQRDLVFRAECLLRLATTYAEMGDDDGAIEMFHRATATARSSRDRELLVNCLYAWGMAAQQGFDPLSAINLLNRARAEARGPHLTEVQERIDTALSEILLSFSEL